MGVQLEIIFPENTDKNQLELEFDELVESDKFKEKDCMLDNFSKFNSYNTKDYSE